MIEIMEGVLVEIMDVKIGKIMVEVMYGGWGNGRENGRVMKEKMNKIMRE